MGDANLGEEELMCPITHPAVQYAGSCSFNDLADERWEGVAMYIAERSVTPDTPPTAEDKRALGLYLLWKYKALGDERAGLLYRVVPKMTEEFFWHTAVHEVAYHYAHDVHTENADIRFMLDMGDWKGHRPHMRQLLKTVFRALREEWRASGFLGKIARTDAIAKMVETMYPE